MATPQKPVTEWDANGNPVSAPSAATEWDANGNAVTPSASAPPEETATDRLTKGMGTEPATIGAAPTGAKAWLQNAENDLRHGGQTTFVGKLLHAAGANPNGLDSGTGSYAADTVASVPLGLLHAAQGIAETPEHPVMGPLHALGGVAQAATIPGAFVAPETQALKDASLASKARQAVLPTTEEAGKLFQPIEAAAKNTPVNLSKVRQIAEEAQRSDAAGGGAPPVIKKFLARTEPTPANYPFPAEPPAPMNYPEARLFAQNSGRLSATDRLAANKPMQRIVAQFAGALKDANRDAAEAVGMGKQYDQAMSRYRTASQLQALKENALKYATGAVVGGLGAEALYHLISNATTKAPSR